MEDLDLPWTRTALARLPAPATGLPAAMLLGGQAGLGKRVVALFLARALLCETRREVLAACGTCPSCKLMDAGTHPDLRLIELASEEEAGAEEEVAEPGPAKKASKQITVGRVRELGEFVTTSAHRGGAKAVVIAPAEAMHPAAANAVLKILEEPPGRTHFLLVSHQPERLLATIRSRCFQVPFAVPAPEVGLAWLKARGVEGAELALAQGGYAPLAALDFAHAEDYWTQRKAFLETLARPGFNPVTATERADPLDPPVIAGLLLRWAYDLAAVRFGGRVRYHLDFRGALEKLAGGMPPVALMRWYTAVLAYGRAAQHPLNKKLALESVLSGYPVRS
jgi:DNA polymerase-3 subunit delta'